MAAGTTVSRLTRLRPGRAAVLRARQVVARRRVQRRELAAEHALHPAGRRHLQRRPGAAAGAVTPQRPRPRRRLHQPGRHRGRTVPGRGDGAAGGRGAVARRPRRPDVRRSGARLGDRLHPALPAAGLLLRDVRPGRADPQRSRVVRADDVGADRQQRDLRRGAAGLHRRLRPGRGRRGARSLLLRPGAAARPRLDARDRGPAADPGAVPASRRIRLPAAARPAWQRPRAHAATGHLDGALRDRQPGRLHRRAAARHGRCGRVAGRHRLHRLLLQLPRRDGPALDRDGLAGDRDADRALGARGRR